MYRFNPIGNGPESPVLSKHVKKIPQPLVCTAGQNEDCLSDSGDSLFLTQNPVPDGVRSARRRHHGKSSGLTYSRYLEESEVESSASSSQEESGAHKSSSRKKSCLPNYTFSFLPGSKPEDTILPAQKNRVLHTFAVTGFFKCLSEFAAKTSLPTLDTDKEEISPLSEEEQEEPHIEGFRIVDKKCFATALKAKSCQMRCNQRKQQKNAGYVREKTLREKPLKMQEKTPAEASVSMERKLLFHTKRSSVAIPSSDFLAETKELDKLTPNSALKTKTCVTLGTEEARKENNSDAAVGEQLDVGGGWEVHNQTEREEMVDTGGHQTWLHTTLLGNSNKRRCIDTRVKKKKKKKKKGQTHASVEGRRQEESENLHVLESVTLEDKTQAPQTAEDIVANQGSLHDDKTDRQVRTSRKHGKRNGKKTKTENIVREGHLDSDAMITDSIISLEGGGKQKNNDATQIELSSTANGNLNGAERVKIKRKKTKKDKGVIAADRREESPNVTRQLEESGNASEKGSTFEKVIELSYSQRQKHTKKQRPSCSEDPLAAEVMDKNYSNIAATLKERTGKSHKKKKKKKKKKNIRDEEEISNALEHNLPNSNEFAEDQSAKPEQKHKTKMDTSEDIVAQNCPVAVQKKRRTSSFLCADAVEKDVQTALEHISFPTEVLDTQSAETTTNLEQSVYRVKKKKTKHDCKDAADRGVKRKKDSEKDQNGLVTTEMMESAAVLGPLEKKSKEDSCCVTEESPNVGTFDGIFKPALYSQTPEKQTLKDKNSKTDINTSAVVPLQGELLTNSAHLQYRKEKKQQTAAPLTSDMSIPESEISSSDFVVSKKHKKLKRKLYNPTEGVFE